MSNVFADYCEAFNHAAKLATNTGLPVVIRKCKEYGKLVYATNFKTHDGSDYLAETVLPNQPLTENKNDLST